MFELIKKTTVILTLLTLSGCLIVLDDDCDRTDPDYWYTEYDCYYVTETFEVCGRNSCWIEDRSRRVCDEYYICEDREWR